MNRRSYNVLFVGGEEVYEHRLIAAAAIGRPLKDGEHIHHMDGNGKNNSPENLVICPSDAYHKLLHQRMTALAESGNADNMKCEFCGAWDKRTNLKILTYKEKKRRTGQYRTRIYHPKCNAEHAAAYYANKRALKALGYKKAYL